MDFIKKTPQFFTGFMLSGLLGFAASAPAAPPPPPSSLTLSQVPLYLVGNVPPNIMLMLDNSGSMSNIVPDAPYDASTTYLSSCPSANTVAGGVDPPAFPNNSDTFDIRVVSGVPKIRLSGTNYNYGTGSGQKCFSTTKRYNARLNANADCSGNYCPSGYLDAVYTGNYLNWYFGSSPTTWGSTDREKPGTQSRLEIAKTAAKSLMDSLNNVRVGLSTYNNGDGGTLSEVIGDIATNRTSIKTKIDALAAGGNTPLAETLSDIGRYFTTGYSGSLTLHPGQTNQSTDTIANVFNNHSFNNASGQTITAPIQYFCQKCFAILMTDGRPQGDREISASLRDYTGDCAKGLCNATPNSTDTSVPDPLTATKGNGTKIGRGYETEGSDYLDDVAQALFEMDLRPNLTDPSGKPKKNNIQTYTIGFADEQVKADPLMKDTAARSGGLFISAENSAQLLNAFQSAVVDITGKVSAASSVALNSGSVSSDSHLYQARFNSSTWTGQLLSFPVKSDPTKSDYGTLGPQNWDAGAILNGQDPNTRKILTYKPSTKIGIPFRWPANPLYVSGTSTLASSYLPGASELDRSQITYLNTNPAGSLDTPPPRGSERLTFLRGTDVSGFRSRGGSKLGDIAYSSPAFVGAPQARYPDNWGTGIPETAAPYSSFKSSKASRTAMVYVGANDGMLHGFDANTGAERLAYVPAVLFKDLSKLTDPNYVHRFYVDGSPTVGDAFFGGGWHTVLVAGLRGGGQGIYALDITDPPSTSDTETGIAGKVLWEFTDANDADLGFTYSEPNIVRMHNDKWVAVFGNGYNNTVSDGSASTSGNALLYIVDIANGSLIAKIDTKKGYLQDPKNSSPPVTTDPLRPNGLATPAPIDANGDSIVDYIYAGDLFGNLWKFDVTNSDPTQWKVAYGTTSNPEPLFSACAGTSCTTGATSNYQPITTRPEVGRHPMQPGGFLVYFGTGKYFEAGDSSPTAQTTQSFYGIWDQNKTTGFTAFGRGKLLEQKIEKEVPQTFGGNSYDLRLVTKNPIDWTPAPPGAGHMGWYLDLVNQGVTPLNNQGEKQVSDPILRNGHIILTTLIPSDAPCGSGGTGWLMELDAASGGEASEAPFDLNGDGLFNELDYAEDSVNPDKSKKKRPPSGKKSKEGIIAQPGIVAGNGDKHKDQEFKFSSGSNKGEIEPTVENAGKGYVGRTSWRELQR